MAEQLQLSVILPTAPETLYQAWLDSAAHSAFTGSPAEIEARVNGVFSAWDGYITGITLELDPPRRIRQAWRTSDFPQDAPDSYLDIWFLPHEGGTQLKLLHTNIPEGQAEDYRQGWKDFYFDPMLEFFSKGR